MNYSYVSTPNPVVTSTTEAVVQFTRGEGGNGQVPNGCIPSSDPRDTVMFFGENQGATDVTMQIYGVVKDTDNPLTTGVAVGSSVALTAGNQGQITLFGATNGFPLYVCTLDAASATPAVRVVCIVKSAT